MSEDKKCELCKERDVTILCSECHKCYCNECSEFIHKKANFKDHKVEAIAEGIIVSATCLLHENKPLELFCVDEVKLCCALCKEEKLHENHKLVDIAEIQNDNEIFSAQKVKELFEDFRGQAIDLDKRIENLLNNIENEVSDIQEKVKKTFEEEYKKLKEEEKKVMRELEEEKSRNEASLEKYLKNLRKTNEYNNSLSEFDTKTKGKCSILMELNIVSDMEKQRKELELLCGKEMYDLHFTWDDKERNLSYAKKLFNGAPVPSNITFPNILYREVEITWECDLDKVREEEIDKISYVVEMAKNDKEEWKEVYSGKEMKCVVNDLEMGTEYAARVRCAVDGSMGRWSENRNVKTKEIYPPKNVVLWSLTWDSIEVSWEDIDGASCYRVEMKMEEDKDFVEIYRRKETKFTKRGLLPDTKYSFRACSVRGNEMSEWSDIVKGKTMKWENCCVWKKCPDEVNSSRKYSIIWSNSRAATMIGDNYDHRNCTVIGNTPFPLNKITSCKTKVLKSKDNDCKGIFTGIAPFDINQNQDDNYSKCGWYFNCYESSLRSGPPHKYDNKEYGPRNWNGEYVHIGDSVGITIDTTKGELFFAINNVNLGIAYSGIPLDKPLVPCVILKNKGDSVEIDTSEVKESVSTSIPIPSSIIAKSDTWDSIILTWDVVEGAEFYQIEVDGNKSWDATITNKLTKRGFLPETEHTFRVRTIKDNAMSEWSDVVKARTMGKSLETSGWKECPDYVNESYKYLVNVNNFRVATKKGDDWVNCTIIGNTPIPLNKVTSWNIKVLKSKYNDGNGIFIGVAPFDINQKQEYNYSNCGWYFRCDDSTLHSGPPHKYWSKIYGLRKKRGHYVRIGDSVGVVIGTIKGELSFIVKGINYGVAYDGIPLDKPLVPCVILNNKGDSVELDTSEMKENVDSTIHIPSNVIAKSGITWDSITLTWDVVEGAEFYQIEVDGNKSWDATITNKLTKKGLLPETEYTFRIRTIKDNAMSEWSDVVKARTMGKSLETSGWKERTGAYSVNEDNPRIATKVDDGNKLCTLIGNTYLFFNKVTSWNIKILKSRNNDGKDIYVGVSSSNINLNDDDNQNKCGWYFDCYSSGLFSGPPHNYKWKKYGPRNWDGKYVRTKGSVGIMMDTTKGELSFVLNGVNYGVAYDGIPLDKPLVPCVILRNKGDSVELDTYEMKEILDTDNSCILS